MGRKYKKRGDIRMCIADSPFCTAETNTALERNYNPSENFTKREVPSWVGTLGMVIFEKRLERCACITVLEASTFWDQS